MRSFHQTQVTSQMQSRRWPGNERIAGHTFPVSGDADARIDALQQAVISLARAIDALAGEVESVNREVLSK